MNVIFGNGTRKAVYPELTYDRKTAISEVPRSFCGSRSHLANAPSAAFISELRESNPVEIICDWSVFPDSQSLRIAKVGTSENPQ